MADNPFKPLVPVLRLTPSAPRTRSRSPRRSPDRSSRLLSHELDPLLSNLSPQSTLAALSAADVVPADGNKGQDLLAKSIANVSTVERAFGIRAALAGQKLREWYSEILSWDWPKKQDAVSGKGFLPPVMQEEQAEDEEAEYRYFGSLPRDVVDQHEDRIEEIKDDMDALEVDELKEHVLNAHIPSRSRPTSSSSIFSTDIKPLSYVQLSDFTAVVTATILQALPVLSKLNSLLSTWDIRLIVLRQIPDFLKDLKTARTAIDEALGKLKNGMHSDDSTPFSQEAFTFARQLLEPKVSILGTQLDRMLDELEGRQDSLPDAWIDEMEAIEADFATWVSEAQKIATANEWRRLKSCSPQPKSPVSPPASPTLTHDKPVPSEADLTARDVDREENIESSTADTSIEATTNQEATSSNTDQGPPVDTSTVPDSKATDDTVGSSDLTSVKLEKSILKSKDPHIETTDSLVPVVHSPAACSYELETPLKEDTTNLGDLTPLSQDKSDECNSSASTRSSIGLSTLDTEVSEAQEPSPSSTSAGSPNSVIRIDISERQKENDGPLSLPYSGNSPEWTPCRRPSIPRRSSLPPALNVNKQQQHENSDDRVTRSRNIQRSLPPPTGELPRKKVLVPRAPSNSGVRRVSSTQDMGSQVKPPRKPGTAPRTLASSRLPDYNLPRNPRSAELANNVTRSSSLPQTPSTHPPNKAAPKTSRPIPQTPRQNPNYPITPAKTRDRARNGTTNKPSVTCKSPEDHLEEQISSILTTIPARIHLGSIPDQDERNLSNPDLHSRNKDAHPRSPSPSPSRAATPTPSLTLTPAFSRSKRRRVQPSDDTTVRLYHLHRGGKSSPVKLFVRLVGESGERVMVRVGGGWADLGEYLREYAMHHGRRRLSNERIEVQEFRSATPPLSRPPTRLSPRQSNGRTTPVPRPGSAFEIRPPSPLFVRKVRRSTGGATADRPTLTAENIEKASRASSAASHTLSSSRRRPSISSTTSMSVASTLGDTSYLTPQSLPPSGHSSTSHSTPLGLAGPTPRSRHVSMSPESEAWVEDVMDQARKSSAALRTKMSSGSLRGSRLGPVAEIETRPLANQGKNATNKMRSVSDIGGTTALNKRVLLRGMNRGKD